MKRIRLSFSVLIALLVMLALTSCGGGGGGGGGGGAVGNGNTGNNSSTENNSSTGGNSNSTSNDIPAPAGMISVAGGTDRNNNNITNLYVCDHEVTQEEYREVMGRLPPSITNIVDSHPIYNIGWYDAIGYCNKLSEKEGRTPVYTKEGINVTWNQTANGYRLPTIAEWEYAASNKGTDTYAGTSDENKLGEYAWYGDNSNRSVQNVKTKKPNGLGCMI